MKLAIVCLSFVLASFTARALTPAQVKSTYLACVRYLRMTPAQQVLIARSKGYPASVIREKCEGAIEGGLAQMLEAEREYQRAKQGSSSSRQPECTSNFQCAGHSQCVGGSCEEIGGPRSDCRNNGGCAPGFQCREDGICS